MPLPTDEKRIALAREVVQAFDNVNGGVHAGHRPAHAKGTLLSGTFAPSRDAATISRAPHFSAPSTPVFLRFSDFAGIPIVPDNDEHASPRGCAIRFMLGDHQHTDIVAHSTDSFPVSTAEGLVEFLNAIHATTPDAPHPNAIEQFLGSHPAALNFVQIPKPFPTSFARENFFSVTAYKFVDAAGAVKHVRYRVKPESGTEYLDAATAAAKGPNYLMEELATRLASSPIRMQLWVQVAAEGDTVDNATVSWPAERPEVLLGTATLTAIVPTDNAEGARIIFDPIPRVNGIEASADPLLQPRADVYLMTGKRRRDALGH
jgi:catalase